MTMASPQGLRIGNNGTLVPATTSSSSKLEIPSEPDSPVWTTTDIMEAQLAVNPNNNKAPLQSRNKRSLWIVACILALLSVALVVVVVVVVIPKNESSSARDVKGATTEPTTAIPAVEEVPVRTILTNTPDTTPTTTAPSDAPSSNADGDSAPSTNPSTPAPSFAPSAEKVTNSTNTTTTYKVEYVGRFQQIVSPECTNSNPAILLTCLGEVRNVTTSHPSIVCGSESSLLNDGARTAILCLTTCNGAECEDVFLTRNESAPFGEVHFTCFGSTPTDTDGSIILVKANAGVCEGGGGDGINLNRAQLGVKCPDANEEYVFDDHYTDCGVPNRVEKVDGKYSCLDGEICGIQPCLVQYKDLVVSADPHHFESCIQSSDGSSVPALSPPEVPFKEAGTYSATFRTDWELGFSSGCSQDAAELITCTCTNGSIRLESSLGTDSCNVTSQETLECTNATAEAGWVVYVCESSGSIPETHVAYESGNLTCDTPDLPKRQLQLGILCDDPGYFAYADAFVECGEKNAFEILDGHKLTCSSTASDSNETTTLEVEIFTDHRWLLWPTVAEKCYNYTAS